MSDSNDVTPNETPKPTPPPSDPNGAAETDPARLPDDHPLVKALAAQKDEIKALKAKATRLDEIEDASKTEAQRAAEALADAKAEAVQARAELLRYRAAAEYGITSAEDIELFLTGSDEETLQRQAKALSERSAAASKPRAPMPDPNQGSTGVPPASVGDQFAAAFKGRV